MRRRWSAAAFLGAGMLWASASGGLAACADPDAAAALVACTQELDAAIAASSPDLRAALYNRMRALLRNGHSDAALGDYAKLAPMVANSEAGDEDLAALARSLSVLAAQAYIQKNDPDGAIRVIQESRPTEAYDRSLGIAASAIALLEKGDLDGAIGGLNDAADVFKDVQLYPVLGRLFETLKVEPARAVAYCDMLFPGAECGKVQLAAGDRDGAMRAMAHGINDEYLNRNTRRYSYFLELPPRLGPKDPLPEKWQACLDALPAAKENACAGVLADNARLDPVRRYTAIYEHATALIRLERIDEALGELADAARLEADGFAEPFSHPEPGVLAAEAELHRHRPDDALAALATVAAREGASLRGLATRRSLALLSKGDAEGAVAALDGPGISPSERPDALALYKLLTAWSGDGQAAVAICAGFGFKDAACGAGELAAGDKNAAMKRMAWSLNQLYLGATKQEIE